MDFDFVESLKLNMENHKFRHLLFPKDPIRVGIHTADDTYYLVLSQEKVDILQELNVEENCSIRGDRKLLQGIFNGDIRLQDAKNNQQIQVSSNYRTMLLLESIFWFNRKEMNN